MKTRRVARVRGRWRPSLEWISGGFFAAGIDSGDRTLALYLMPIDGSWSALAVETASDSMSSIAAVLADHGHKLIGEYGTAREAFDAAEAFGKKWHSNRVKKAWACACKKIRVRRSRVSGRAK